MKGFHIIVFGRVQGVFFRYNTKNKADKLKINGFIKNLSDKRVEIVAEGDKENIKRFLEWCKKGSVLVNIKDIEFIDDNPEIGFKGFEIRY